MENQHNIEEYQPIRGEIYPGNNNIKARAPRFTDNDTGGIREELDG